MERGVPRETRQRLQLQLTGERECHLGREKAILGNRWPGNHGFIGEKQGDPLHPG